jgi:ABC-type dipeptide/oligopeptide/nickel transport system permease subunit
VAEQSEDGLRLVLEATVSQHHFLFGTDANGRDLLTRTLIAGRISLMIGLLATGVALVIGVTYGAIAGYFGGRIDAVMMRLVDILYSLPFMFFVILLHQTTGVRPGGPCPRCRQPGHPEAPHRAQHPGPGRRLHDPAGAQGHSAGELSVVSRLGRAGAHDLLGRAFCLNFIGDGLRDALDPKDR